MKEVYILIESMDHDYEANLHVYSNMESAASKLRQLLELRNKPLETERVIELDTNYYFNGYTNYSIEKLELND